MLRPIRIALGLALMLSISERTVHAQYAGLGRLGRLECNARG